MSWILFYVLAALHPVAFMAIGWYSKTWGMRLLLWAMLPMPAVLYCWDYFEIKKDHERMCSSVGGLRVLVQPEKVDRVRLLGVEFRNLGAAQGVLNRHYPTIRVVESMRGVYDGTAVNENQYVAYTLVPNPAAGLPMPKDPWKEPRFIVEQSQIATLDPNVYEISHKELSTHRSATKETVLSRQGKTYARYTEIVHWWTGIRYPDAVPTWRCPDQRQAATATLPYDLLVKLILK